jgi:hypothetical protein
MKRLVGRRAFGINATTLSFTSPFDILGDPEAVSRLGQLFSPGRPFIRGSRAYSAKLTVIVTPAKSEMLILLDGRVFSEVRSPGAYVTLVAVMALFTTIYTLTFVFKFVLTLVGSSRKEPTWRFHPRSRLLKTDLPVYTVLVPMYKAVLPLLIDAAGDSTIHPANSGSNSSSRKTTLRQSVRPRLSNCRTFRNRFRVPPEPAQRPSQKHATTRFFTRRVRHHLRCGRSALSPISSRRLFWLFVWYFNPSVCPGTAQLPPIAMRNWLTQMFTLGEVQPVVRLSAARPPDWLRNIPLGSTSGGLRLEGRLKERGMGSLQRHGRRRPRLHTGAGRIFSQT